ncbi:MAG TPA: CDP-glycerol glycerophosphotransferase family protein [Polyangiaceae bacterium]|nr:CDP-glycerol glycerophosphotransferase family protein [Polyangiaceae bacterium]
MPISRLTLQNLFASLTLPLYLLARPLLWLLRVLRPGRSSSWVLGGHSGRLYADNAGALHERLHAQGHDVIWISAEPAITALLRARGARVLERNSFRARLAIENAGVLAYSHSLTDLDHILGRCLGLRGLKIHLNHCMSHLKAWNPSRYPAHKPSSARGVPFDYMLASSERERQNLERSFVGAGEHIVVGGGAHIDLFMRARSQQPARQITYFATYRESAAARARLEAEIEALAAHPALGAWLEQHDYNFYIVGHVNTGRAPRASSSRVHFGSSQDLTTLIVASELLISDYSGLICDYLALDRPMVFFAFDKVEYLAQRKLYVDYDEFAFGPQVSSVDELVALITSGRFRDDSAYKATRRRWERELFPSLEPSYAERTEFTIRALAARRGGG